MSTPAKRLAAQLAAIDKRTSALERGSQLPRSTVQAPDGTAVGVADAAQAAAERTEAIPGLQDALDTTAEEVEAASAAADEATEAGLAAGEAGLAAAEDAQAAADEANFEAIAAQAAAAEAKGEAAAAAGKAATAVGQAAEAAGRAAEAETAAGKATSAAQQAFAAAGEADTKAVDAAAAARAANAEALKAAGIANNKGEVIRQASKPTGSRASAANLWIRTSDNKPHVYDPAIPDWVPATDQALVKAAADVVVAQKAADDAARAAQMAQVTADGKSRVTYGTTEPPDPAPAGTQVGDLWFRRQAGTNSTTGIWEYTTQGWAERTLADQVIGNLDAGKITAGFLDARRIDASTITARMLAIGDFENLADDGTFESATSRASFPRTGAWSYGNNAAGAHSGTWYTVLNPSTTSYSTTTVGPDFQVQGGDKIYMEWWQRRYNADRAACLNLQVLDSSKATIAFDVRPASPQPTAPNDVWVKYSGQVTMPAGAAWARPQFKVNTNQTLTGSWAFDDVVIRRATAGELIVDGAISAEKLAVNSVTASSIVAGTITAAELATNSVTTAKIVAGAVTATEIAAGTITGSKIAAGTIVAGNIGANAVAAEQLAADSVTAVSIKAGEITTAKLAASAVTAEKIMAATITGGKLAANAITAREIAADAVTAAQIRAGSIDGMVVTGATIRTATSGARLEFSGSSLTGYANSGAVFAQMDPSGGGLLRMSNQNTGTATVKGVTWHGGGVVFTHPTYADSTTTRPEPLAAPGIGWSKGSSGTVPAFVFGTPTLAAGSAAGGTGFLGTAITASGAVIVSSYSAGMSPQITLDDTRMTLLGGGENVASVPRLYVGQLGNPRGIYLTAGDNPGDGTIGGTIGVAGEVAMTSGYLSSQGTQYQSTFNMGQNIILRAARVGGLGNKAEIQVNGSDAVILTAPTAASTNRTDLSVRSSEVRVRFGSLVVEGVGRFTDSYNLAVAGRTAVLRSDGTIGYSGSKRALKAYLEPIVVDEAVADRMLALQPTSYVMRSQYDSRRERQRQHGFIAEEVHAAGFTELVDYGADENGEMTDVPEALFYDRFVSLLWAQNQHQERRLRALEQQLSATTSEA